MSWGQNPHKGISVSKRSPRVLIDFSCHMKSQSGDTVPGHHQTPSLQQLCSWTSRNIREYISFLCKLLCYVLLKQHLWAKILLSHAHPRTMGVAGAASPLASTSHQACVMTSLVTAEVIDCGQLMEQFFANRKVLHFPSISNCTGCEEVMANMPSFQNWRIMFTSRLHYVFQVLPRKLVCFLSVNSWEWTFDLGM